MCVSDVGVERGWGWGDAPGMRREGGEGRPFLDAGVRWGTVRGLRLLWLTWKDVSDGREGDGWTGHCVGVGGMRE